MLRSIHRNFLRISCTNVLLPNCVLRKASNRPDYFEDQIALSDDKRTIICWHPEKPFPYECSLPLPQKPAETSDSPLKVQCTSALKHIYRQKTPEFARQELMKLTHTTKHIWFPNNKKWKRKKTEMDRPYL